MIIYRCDSLDADDADDADSFSLLTDYPLSKIIDQRHQRHLRLKTSSASKELNSYLSYKLNINIYLIY